MLAFIFTQLFKLNIMSQNVYFGHIEQNRRKIFMVSVCCQVLSVDVPAVDKMSVSYSIQTPDDTFASHTSRYAHPSICIGTFSL